MTWRLFLDDLRDPASTDPDIILCRTSQEALVELRERGCPVEMMLDHDLGPGDDAQIFVNGFIDLVLDGMITIPEGFTFSVHSMNPVGAELLSGKMSGIVSEMRVRKDRDIHKNIGFS